MENIPDIHIPWVSTWSTRLYFTVLHCILLYCAVLYCKSENLPIFNKIARVFIFLKYRGNFNRVTISCMLCHSLIFTQEMGLLANFISYILVPFQILTLFDIILMKSSMSFKFFHIYIEGHKCIFFYSNHKILCPQEKNVIFYFQQFLGFFSVLL